MSAGAWYIQCCSTYFDKSHLESTTDVGLCVLGVRLLIATRVYLLAKELGVKSSAIVKKCQDEGLDIKNHMSPISLSLATTITEWFSQKKTVDERGQQAQVRGKISVEEKENKSFKKHFDIPKAFPNIERKVQLAEKFLRSYVLDNLKHHYGNNQWWKQGIPGGVKTDVDQRWHKHLEAKPHLRKNGTDVDKFEFADIGQLISIVVYGPNWDRIFKDVFANKVHFQQRVRQVKALRDPLSHSRTIDDQDAIDGVAGLLWLNNAHMNPCM
jgi:hypothetical protein